MSLPEMADLTMLMYYRLDEIEAMHAGTMTELGSSGKILLEYSIGGRTVRKEFAIPPADMLRAINWALNFKDPETYPALTDRTIASFS